MRLYYDFDEVLFLLCASFFCDIKLHRERNILTEAWSTWRLQSSTITSLLNQADATEAGKCEAKGDNWMWSGGTHL